MPFIPPQPKAARTPVRFRPGWFDQMLGRSASFAQVVVGLAVIVLALQWARAVFAPILISMVIGLVFGPIADKLERRGVPPALSAAVVVLAFIAVIAAGIMLFTAPVSEWIAKIPALWNRLRSTLDGVQQPFEAFGAFQEELRAVFGSDGAVEVEIKDGSPAESAALMAPSVLSEILVFLGSLYFFLASRHQLRVAVLSSLLSRRLRWRTAHIFRDVEARISRFLLSTGIINLSVGVATGLGMWALGLPSPLLWGALAAIANFVPYIGQLFMFAVLLGVGLATYTDLSMIALPVVVYAILNFTADQIIFPHFMGHVLTLNPFVIFAALITWIWIWGPIGTFLAVPSLLVIQSIFLNLLPATPKTPPVTAAVEARGAQICP